MSRIAAYQEHAVTTQSKGHLVVLLYDGAIRFLNQAIEALEAGDLARKGELVGKAMDIVNELDTALDMDAGGEIANNLRSLYDFMRRHLLQGHLRNNAQTLRDVVAILEELNEAWRTITG